MTVRHLGAADQVGRYAEEVARQLLYASLQVAQDHPLGAVPATERHAREVVVAKRTPANELVIHTRVDLLGVEFLGEERADECAHAHAADAIDLDTRGRQLFDDAQMREGPCSAPRQDKANRAPGQA